MTSDKCLHCKRKKVNRPRGLCYGCYYRPGVREQYEPIAGPGRRSPVPSAGGSRLPAKPTSAAPGSAEKVAVLCERAMKGESLWHPEDPADPTAAGLGGGRGADRPCRVLGLDEWEG